MSIPLQASGVCANVFLHVWKLPLHVFVWVNSMYLYMCGCELYVLCLYLHSRYQILAKMFVSSLQILFTSN